MIEYRYFYRTHFLGFSKLAFRLLHPGMSLTESWHVSLVANMLDFCWRTNEPGAFRRLIFNLPPECLKTHLCSISLPAWILGRDPRQNVLIVSETPEHARVIQERCQELMESSSYRALFPKTRIKRVTRNLELTGGGGIRHAGIGYTLPHRQSDLVVIDNPESLHRLDPRRYGSLNEAGRLLKRPDKGLIILATRRLGPEDMSDFLYRKGGWAVFAFPAIGLREQRWHFPPDDDYTQQPGIPLSWRLDWDELEARLHELGGEAFAYQYLQGEYVPTNTFCSNMGIDQNGRVVMFANKPSLTSVAANYLKGLRAEYEERRRKQQEAFDAQVARFLAEPAAHSLS